MLLPQDEQRCEINGFQKLRLPQLPHVLCGDRSGMFTKFCRKRSTAKVQYCMGRLK
jgi:hypothetical protein